jgi:hypothetical protein
MRRYWDLLDERTVGQFTVRIEKSWEDLSPHDLFDPSVDDIDEICRRIDAGYLDWFMLKATVYYEGVSLADDIVGGFLYEDARDVLKDGTADDLVASAIDSAVEEARVLKQRFGELDLESLV